MSAGSNLSTILRKSIPGLRNDDVCVFLFIAIFLNCGDKLTIRVSFVFVFLHLSVFRE